MPAIGGTELEVPQTVWDCEDNARTALQKGVRMPKYMQSVLTVCCSKDLKPPLNPAAAPKPQQGFKAFHLQTPARNQ